MKLYHLQCHYENDEVPKVDNFVGVFENVELAKDAATKSKFYFGVTPLVWEQDGNEWLTGNYLDSCWFSIKEIELNEIIH